MSNCIEICKVQILEPASLVINVNTQKPRQSSKRQFPGFNNSCALLASTGFRVTLFLGAKCPLSSVRLDFVFHKTVN